MVICPLVIVDWSTMSYLSQSRPSESFPELLKLELREDHGFCVGDEGVRCEARHLKASMLHNSPRHRFRNVKCGEADEK